MSILGESHAFKLAQATDGTLSIESQEKGFVTGLVHEAVGIVDGGMSGSVGASHTTAVLAKAFIGAKFKDQIGSLPVVGQLVN